MYVSVLFAMYMTVLIFHYRRSGNFAIKKFPPIPKVAKISRSVHIAISTKAGKEN